MPLPTIVTPTYELELPSTGKKIKYRPFLVKEEKLLILALETENPKDISNAIKTVLKNCIQSRGVKVETLPTFDIEYLFLNIRGKSVGEIIELNLICPDDGETQVPAEINLDTIKVRKDDSHNKTIKLDEKLVMEMKYPSLDQFVRNNFEFNEDTVDMDQSFELIASCVNKIYNEEEVWSSADVTKKELVAFLEQMNTIQFKEIEKFFETMPKLKHTIEVTNPNTNVKSEVVLEGLSSFFD